VRNDEPIGSGGPAALQKPAEPKPDGSPASAAAAPALRRVSPPQPKPDAVIPLVHAPDDPGPVVADEDETSAEPSNGGWRKIFE
jgi:HemY protein